MMFLRKKQHETCSHMAEQVLILDQHAPKARTVSALYGFRELQKSQTV